MSGADVKRIRGVVVGYDGSECGERTLDWAAAEAVARGMPLTVVHVWEPVLGASMAMPTVDLRAMAESTLAGALEHLGRSAPGLEVRPLLEHGSPAARLIEVSGRAELVVVGSRGRGGFAGLVLGSVGAQVAAHAACPVVVVRGESEPAPEDEPGRVVVGVDGSPASRAAVEVAFAEADAHRVPLTVVVAWQPVPELSLPLVMDGVRTEMDARLERLLMPLRERYRNVSVRTRIVEGVPREVLLNASHGARLLVVGTRGLGGIRGLLLGSVSQAMLHHASCPVAVVPCA